MNQMLPMVTTACVMDCVTGGLLIVIIRDNSAYQCTDHSLGFFQVSMTCDQ